MFVLFPHDSIISLQHVHEQQQNSDLLSRSIRDLKIQLTLVPTVKFIATVTLNIKNNNYCIMIKNIENYFIQIKYTIFCTYKTIA